MHKTLKTILLSLAAFPLLAAANPANDEVTKLVQAKLPDSVIIAKINELGPKLDTSTEALIALKEAGASDAVLDAVAKQMKPGAQATPANQKESAVPAFKGVESVKPVIFKFNRVEFRSLKVVQNEVRVTIGLVNKGDLTHEYYGGNSSTGNPAIGSCEQARLSDNLGNDYKCKSASLPLLGTVPYSRPAGASAQPGDTVLVTYVFERPAGTTAVASYSFSAQPVAHFIYGGLIPSGAPIWGDLTVAFDDLTPQSRPSGEGS